MALSKIIAVALFAIAAIDLVVGVAVIRPRLPENRQRIVIGALATSSLLMVVLGLAFWSGWIPLN